MSTLVLAFRNRTAGHPAIITGTAPAATVVVFYGLCTLVWVAAPSPFTGFMNSLFHGIDFTPLLKPGPFSWAAFGGVLLVMAVWAFLTGTFFGWLRQRLSA